MKRHGNKSKKTSRRQTRLRTLRTRDEGLATIQESSIKNARIKSAIEKGAESKLPSDTATGHCLKKFEHNGKEGPLVVYAEDRKMFNEYGHFTVITSFKPSDSLRNQLFFGSHASIPRNLSKDELEIPQANSVDNKFCNSIRQESKSNHRQKNNDNNVVKQPHRQMKSFEGLVTRYKNRQDKYRRLLGDDAVYLFQKIDHLCKAKEDKKTQKSEKNVQPVLPKITVDDKTTVGNENNMSNEIQLSSRKTQPRLPYLTVSRYSTL